MLVPSTWPRVKPVKMPIHCRDYTICHFPLSNSLGQCSSNFKEQINLLEMLLNAGSDAVDLRWGLIFCTSTELQGLLMFLASGLFLEQQGFEEVGNLLLGQIQPGACFCQASFLGTQAFVYVLSLAAFVLQGRHQQLPQIPRPAGAAKVYVPHFWCANTKLPI